MDARDQIAAGVRLVGSAVESDELEGVAERVGRPDLAPLRRRRAAAAGPAPRGVFELIRNGEFAWTSDTVRDVTGGPGTDITAFARDHAAAFAG